MCVGCVTNCGEMVLVPGSSFWQGCNASLDSDCRTKENPYHQVNVPTFEIDKYEVTNSQFRACVDAGWCELYLASKDDLEGCTWDIPGKEDYPADCIFWNEAGSFCKWVGKRLCSESEWEKAARGTDGRIFPWGNEPPTCEHAVMDGCSNTSAAEVGSKPAGASPYGAMDMAGNVAEWVEDDWHDSYEGAPQDGSAWVESPRASDVVLRGSHYSGLAIYGRCSSRTNFPSHGLNPGLMGFRCCR